MPGTRRHRGAIPRLGGLLVATAIRVVCIPVVARSRSRGHVRLLSAFGVSRREVRIALERTRQPFHSGPLHLLTWMRSQPVSRERSLPNARQV